MQSTENTGVTRALDKLSSIAAAYFEISDDIMEACAALAAERDRADRAEAVIANAPHSVMCEDPQTGCTCWKSEATA